MSEELRHEAHYLDETRKAERKKRKSAQAKDRSKYKKTDRTKRKKTELPKNHSLIKGRVLSILAETVTVSCPDAIIYNCTLRGLLKKEKKRLKNLITVGDLVWIQPLSHEEGVIVGIEERYSLLARTEHLTQKKQQLIAANIDQVLITTSLLFPKLKPPLIDRYIIAAKQGGMEPVIVVNKIDLLRDSAFTAEEKSAERAVLKEIKHAYAQAEIPLFVTSTKSKTGLSALKEQMRGKTSVFSGQSGVGKSSLINTLLNLKLKTATVVTKTRKGAHATTTAQLIPLASGGYCIDTPGIKSFGIWNLKKEEIQKYFSEIAAIGASCHFPDCEHQHEPNCAVKQAVKDKLISELRYNSYLQLMQQAEKTHKRR